MPEIFQSADMYLLLAYSTCHTFVMRLQWRLQLLKKAKGSSIQFF